MTICITMTCETNEIKYTIETKALKPLKKFRALALPTVILLWENHTFGMIVVHCYVFLSEWYSKTKQKMQSMNIAESQEEQIDMVVGEHQVSHILYLPKKECPRNPRQRDLKMWHHKLRKTLYRDLLPNRTRKRENSFASSFFTP